MKRLVLLFLMITACSDSSVTESTTQPVDFSRLITIDATIDAQVVQIPDVTVDAWVDPCEGVINTDETYCDCNPSCCQRQTWYCPPTGTEIQAKYAILDICGDDLIPCDRNVDSSCQPAEIIAETDCTHAFDCPPGINEDFTMYYDCEYEGNVGRQEVRCDKGRLYYGECVTCIASDEVCNGLDDDCDDSVDENQLNECGLCGPLPQDTCDGLDNDCDDSIDEDLIRECVTDCERGIEVCVEGSWLGCTARQPSIEQCDGQDNDCDASIDEGAECQCPPEMLGALIPCMEPPLYCGMGFKTCECDNDDCSITKYTDCLALCAWLPAEVVPADDPVTCDTLLGMPIEPEVCNNFDEDCDDSIDENLTKQCYSGPEGTVGIGVCSGGEMLCSEGQWYGELSDGQLLLDFCAGEILPSREICDGADNDCDGITDFGEVIPDTDILFILDWSGSMEYNINAVQIAMSRFANQFSAEQKLKWGLITGPRVFPRPGVPPNQAIEYLRLDANIMNFADFMAAFSSAGTFETSSSSEMLRDAIYLSLKTISTDMPYDLSRANWVNRFNQVDSIPPLDDFKINWRSSADRIIIVFTDEEDQSFLDPELQEGPLIRALEASPDTKLYVFTDFYYIRQWRPFTNATDGDVFTLTTSAEEMYNDLMSILDEICLPDDQSTSLQSSHDYALASFWRYNYVKMVCE